MVQTCVARGCSLEWISSNKWRKNTGTRQYEFSCVTLGGLLEWISLNRWYKLTSSLQYELSCGSLGGCPAQILWSICDSCDNSVLCGLLQIQIISKEQGLDGGLQWAANITWTLNYDCPGKLPGATRPVMPPTYLPVGGIGRVSNENTPSKETSLHRSQWYAMSPQITYGRYDILRDSNFRDSHIEIFDADIFNELAKPLHWTMDYIRQQRVTVKPAAITEIPVPGPR